MRKEYTISELCKILGCSQVAIRKKISSTGDENGIRKYKKRYDVVTKDGVLCVVLDDSELEEEKRLSKGFNNVLNNGVNTSQSDDVIDLEPNYDEIMQERLYSFTERYIKEFTELKEMSNNVILNLEKEKLAYEKQIFLLEDKQNRDVAEVKKLTAQNVILKRNNTLLIVALSLLLIVMLLIATVNITLSRVNDNVTDDMGIKKSLPNKKLLSRLEDL